MVVAKLLVKESTVNNCRGTAASSIRKSWLSLLAGIEISKLMAFLSEGKYKAKCSLEFIYVLCIIYIIYEMVDDRSLFICPLTRKVYNFYVAPNVLSVLKS